MSQKGYISKQNIIDGIEYLKSRHCDSTVYSKINPIEQNHYSTPATLER